MRREPALRLGALILALGLVAAGCGDDESGTTTTTTTDTAPPVSFGEGEIPEAIPDDFPLPQGAIIGSTLVDRINGRTEMEVRVLLAIDDTVNFFGTQLLAAGYTIDDNRATTTGRILDFSKGDLTGSVNMTANAPDVSTAVVRIDDT